MKKCWACIIISVMMMLNVSWAYAAVPSDRVYSTYGDNSVYNNDLKKLMNCYGYAIQVYSKELQVWDNGAYRQIPGEFANNGVTYSSLMQSYNSITNANNFITAVQSNMFADFSSLNSIWGSEWTIISTTASASVPTGYRKIALVVGAFEYGGQLFYDFHFYMRHSNGYWSHKPGETDITNMSKGNSPQLITDSNIASVVQNGGYNAVTPRYYLIKKSAIVDYPHRNGHSLSSTSTSFSITDCAGSSPKKSTAINGSSTGRFDYSSDEDCFSFTPSTSGTYKIRVGEKAAFDSDLYIYDSSGVLLISDTNTTGDGDISISLTASTKYYIKVKVKSWTNVWQYNSVNNAYALYITKQS